MKNVKQIGDENSMTKHTSPEITKICFCSNKHFGFLKSDRKRKYYLKRCRKLNTTVLKNMDSIQKTLYKYGKKPESEEDVIAFRKYVEIFDSYLMDMQELSNVFKGILESERMENNMTERNIEKILTDLIMENSEETVFEDCEIETFAERGFLTRNKGIVINLKDKTEIHLTINVYEPQ